MSPAVAAAAEILVVEDEPAIQALLRYTLEQAGYQVTEAASAEQARERISETLPALVILDWMLPGQSGPALLERLRREPRTRELPVIMVTARSDEADRVAGLERGADDYIGKPFSPRELVARVNAVLRRRAPQLGDQALVAGPLWLAPQAHEARLAGEPLRLAPAEFRLLAFLMAHPGRVYSRAQLLDQVWGDHVFIEERTVDVHVRRLRAALGEAAGALIETVRGAGYRLNRGGAE